MTDQSRDATTPRLTPERLAEHRAAARTLALSLAAGESDDWDELRTLATGASRTTFAETCTQLGFLAGAALAGRSDIVSWLLEAGADPNAYRGHGSEPRQWSDFPLHLVSVAPQDERILHCLELLVRAGASVGEVSPPEESVRTNRWRYSALDVAIRAGRAAAVDALLPHADRSTCEAAQVTAIIATAEDDADRPWLLSLIARLPVAPASTRFGIHALHAAAIIGDLEIWRAIAARGDDPNPRVAVEQSYQESRLPSTGVGWSSLGLRAGGTPLDVVDAVRGLVRSGLARVADARAQRELDDHERYNHDHLTAKLGTLDELARHIQASGGIPGGAAVLLPAVAEIERELSRLAQARGMLDRWRIAVAAADLAGKGPLGFVVMVSAQAREVFSGLPRADAHPLGAFLTGRLPTTVLLATDLDAEELAEVSSDRVVWPKAYPPEAEPLFAYARRYPSALLGREGEALLGATPYEGGTMLWRVTPQRVEQLGDVRAWVREGVDVLLRDVDERPGG